VSPLLRLLRYARPHQGRVVAALPAMAAYALAATGLAALIQPIFDHLLPQGADQGPSGIAALVQPIFDRLLPQGNDIALICGTLVTLYFVKGIAA